MNYSEYHGPGQRRRHVLHFVPTRDCEATEGPKLEAVSVCESLGGVAGQGDDNLHGDSESLSGRTGGNGMGPQAVQTKTSAAVTAVISDSLWRRGNARYITIA